MDVLEAIRSRRSIGRMLSKRPPRETIERILDAAVTAPNHYLTEPWRFVVLTGEARRALGDAQEAALRRTLADPEAAQNQAALEKERRKPFRAPVIVVVAAEHSSGTKADRREDLYATAAATQNLLLAAHAEGLAAIWRTGETAYSPEVKAALGLPETAEVIGIIYLGYADRAQPPAARATRSAPARWHGWEDGTMNDEGAVTTLGSSLIPHRLSFIPISIDTGRPVL